MHPDRHAADRFASPAEAATRASEATRTAIPFTRPSLGTTPAERNWHDRAMATSSQKNIVERLAGAGEEVLERIASIAAAERLVGTLGTLKERVDELQKSVRTIDRLERRLERDRVASHKLEGKTSTKSRKTSSSGSKKRTATRKTERRQLARDPDPQRLRHDLEASGRRSRLLAVELDRQRLAATRRVTSAPRSSSAFGCGRCVPRKIFGIVNRRSRFVRSPISSTSNAPSSRAASGQIFIPPPKYGPLATTTSCMRAWRFSPSTVTSTSLFVQRAKTANVAQT